jgi:dUTP pyrophosphatase
MKAVVEYLHEGMVPLKYARDNDAGADVSLWQDVVIKPGRNIIKLGFKLVIPEGFAGYLCLRSSVMGEGITCLMVPFDADYSAEWNLVVYNNTDTDRLVKKGERICQVVVMPIVQLDFIDEFKNRRGANGLGSTGK